MGKTLQAEVKHRWQEQNNSNEAEVESRREETDFEVESSARQSSALLSCFPSSRRSECAVRQVRELLSSPINLKVTRRVSLVARL
jgi:hypothetical protein